MPEEPMIPGYVVRASYTLTPAEKIRVEELYTIKATSEEKLRAVRQRVVDAERLIHGLITEVKWRLSWPDGDVVLYDPKTGMLQCLSEAKHD
jgi:hypothetical protein